MLSWVIPRTATGGRSGDASMADLLAISEDQRHHELIGGEIVRKAVLSAEHGTAQRRLGSMVDPFDRRPGGRWPGGWWLMTEVEVVFSDLEIYRPDLLGWRRDRVPERPRGTPVASGTTGSARSVTNQRRPRPRHEAERVPPLRSRALDRRPDRRNAFRVPLEPRRIPARTRRPWRRARTGGIVRSRRDLRRSVVRPRRGLRCCAGRGATLLASVKTPDGARPSHAR